VVDHLPTQRDAVELNSVLNYAGWLQEEEGIEKEKRWSMREE